MPARLTTTFRAQSTSANKEMQPRTSAAYPAAVMTKDLRLLSVLTRPVCANARQSSTGPSVRTGIAKRRGATGAIALVATASIATRRSLYSSPRVEVGGCALKKQLAQRNASLDAAKEHGSVGRVLKSVWQTQTGAITGTYTRKKSLYYYVVPQRLVSHVLRQRLKTLMKI